MADVNIMFSWNSGYKGVVPSKSFFYLQFNKPVFVIGKYEEEELKDVLKHIYYHVNNSDSFFIYLQSIKENINVQKNSKEYIEIHSLENRVKQLRNYFKEGIKNYGKN
jgi:hypothetical protein